MSYNTRYFKKRWEAFGLFDLSSDLSLYNDFCSECFEIDSVRHLQHKARPALNQARICPRCGGKDTGFEKQVREAVTALRDIGFKVNDVEVSCFRDFKGNVQWEVFFGFKHEYPNAALKGLPKKLFRRYCFDKGYSSAAIAYIHKHLPEEGFPMIRMTLDDIPAGERIVCKRTFIEEFTAKADVVVAESVATLLKWAERANRLGHTAIWKLAGYFEE